MIESLRRRLTGAMICYAALALIGTFALDGILRGAVLSLLAILAVKTLIHAGRSEEAELTPVAAPGSPRRPHLTE